MYTFHDFNRPIYITILTIVKKEEIPSPDFVKIDTQGSELDILKGSLSETNDLGEDTLKEATEIEQFPCSKESSETKLPLEISFPEEISAFILLRRPVRSGRIWYWCEASIYWQLAKYQF